jgi:hypothetical protein
MGLITLILAEAGGRSHTPFYIVGGLLAAYAVLTTALGFTKPDFPGGEAAARGVMTVGAVLVLGTMGLAVYTAN